MRRTTISFGLYWSSTWIQPVTFWEDISLVRVCNNTRELLHIIGSLVHEFKRREASSAAIRRCNSLRGNPLTQAFDQTSVCSNTIKATSIISNLERAWHVRCERDVTAAAEQFRFVWSRFVSPRWVDVFICVLLRCFVSSFFYCLFDWFSVDCCTFYWCWRGVDHASDWFYTEMILVLFLDIVSVIYVYPQPREIFHSRSTCVCLRMYGCKFYRVLINMYNDKCL